MLEPQIRGLVAKIQNFIDSLQGKIVTHVQYGICDNIENIASFGLRARRGKNFSFLPVAAHTKLSSVGLNWQNCLPLEYCWKNDVDFIWADDTVWSTDASALQSEIQAVLKRMQLGVGVSLPIRVRSDIGHTMGSAILLYAENRSSEEFRVFYDQHHRDWRKKAEALDLQVRAEELKNIFPLTKGEYSVLKLYDQLGDVSRIAELKCISVRSVQLCLQKVRIKLAVDTNIEALNLCRSFGLLRD